MELKKCIIIRYIRSNNWVDGTLNCCINVRHRQTHVNVISFPLRNIWHPNRTFVCQNKKVKTPERGQNPPRGRQETGSHQGDEYCRCDGTRRRNVYILWLKVSLFPLVQECVVFKDMLFLRMCRVMGHQRTNQINYFHMNILLFCCCKQRPSVPPEGLRMDQMRIL